MKNNLEEKLKGMKKALLAMTEEKEDAEKTLDEILLLQKQIDVVPTELDIPVDEVVKRYPVTEAIEIVRCKTAIFFHSTCFWVVSKPTLANNGKGGALFEMLSWYCDYLDTRSEFDEDEKENFDVLCSVIINILSLPLDIFTDLDFTLDIANYILEKRTEYYTRLAEEASKGHEDTVEDAIANAEFEDEVKQTEEIKKEIKDMGEKHAAKKK